jgi:hypothetical protein
VVACRVDLLYFSDEAPTKRTLLPALTAQWNQTETDIEPAQLLLLQPDGLKLTELEITS